jgi:hypothetical protein
VFTETSTTGEKHKLQITGDDPDLIHTEKLDMTILTLPTRGVLFGPDGTTEITANTVIPNSDKDVDTSDGVTTFDVYYQPVAYQCGPDSFTVEYWDPLNAVSNIATIELEVTCVNDPPTSRDVTVGTDDVTPVSFTLTGSDPDMDVLTFRVINTDNLVGEVKWDVDDSVITNGREDMSEGDKNWALHFTYYPVERMESQTVYFTFEFIDPEGLTSGPHTASINVELSWVNTPPIAQDIFASTPEDTPVVITFTDPSIPLRTWSDIDGSEDVFPLFIRTVVPDGEGQVRTQSNTVVVANSEVTRNSDGVISVTYIPPADWSGTTTFTYYVTDTDGADSNIATVTVEVTPVNDPPLVSASPSSILVERLSSDSFTVEIWDIDSDSITLMLAAGNTIPIDLSELATVEWTLADQTEQAITTVTNSNPGQHYIVTITWSPEELLPDGSSGSFTVYALDSDGLQSSNRPVLTVQVVPNDPPYIVDRPDYTISVNEDEWDTMELTLAGADPQYYQTEFLDVIITSYPNTLPLKDDGVTITESNVPFTSPDSYGSDGETHNKVTITNVENFNGVDTFKFRVRDSNGAISPEQTVTITVAPVNDPPVAHDVLLVIYEDSCYDLNRCQERYTDPVTVDYVTINGYDTDGDDVTLYFNALTNLGNIYKRNSNGGVSRVDDLGTNFESPILTWEFYFEPQPDAHSVCEDNANPSVLTCEPYVVIPFSITDGDAVVPYTFTVVVLPTNDPPSSRDLQFTIDEDTELVIDLPAVDIDDAAETINARVTKIRPNSRGEFKDVDGNVIDGNDSDLPPGRVVVYNPPADAFSNPITTPMARFNFIVIDPQGAESEKTYTVTIFVRPTPDVIEYHGPRETTILEDTVAIVPFPQRGSAWNSIDEGEVTVVITRLSEKGSFCENKGGVCEDITELPHTLASKESRVFFYPLPNEFGDNYADFDYEVQLLPVGLTEKTTYEVTFTIHVTPVNDPPVLIPFFDLDPESGMHVLDEDTVSHFYFTATDIDSPPESLTAFWISQGSELDLTYYLCGSSESEDCDQDEILASLGEMPATDVALWRVEVHPDENVHGRTNMAFVVEDDEPLRSNIEPIRIDIRPINDAPVLEAKLVPRNKVETEVDGQVVGVSVTSLTDPDFLAFKEVKITITDDSGNGRFALENFDLSPESEDLANTPCRLAEDELSISCTTYINKIADWVSLVRYVVVEFEAEDPEDVDQMRTLTIVVDDLNNVDHRPDQNLYDTVVLEVPVIAKVNEYSGISTEGNEPEDNSFLIGAGIGGAFLGLLLIAAVAYFKRDSGDDVTKYFDKFSLEMDGTTQESPIYEGATTGGESALYVPNTE